MEVVATRALLAERLDAVRSSGASVGFVPTMGYLHEGHGSLVDASVASTDLTVVSVFVNPLQFGAGEDLDSYPRDLEADLELCGSRGASLLFHPGVEEVYPEGPVQPAVPAVPVADVARPLEGERRPGHFAGVAEVVARLLRAVGPCRAFFGQKDFQQLQVVRRMVVDLGLPVDVVGCPTSREHDGLARSSRNVYLTGAERAAAPVLHRALQAGAAAVAVPGWDRAEVEAMMADLLAGEPTASPEYAVVVDPDTLLPVDHPTSGLDLRVLVACRFGRARLIDNLGVVAG
ncbi:MAG: pantoate--beta-alanine ligase [Actinomycetota bacterium]|nr:pantoate--beta-alanine ligase [Actinomycetota bacterium]